MTEYGVVCPLDGSTKSPGDCYFGDCSNDVYFECYPNKYTFKAVAKPMETYNPKNK